MSRRKKAEAAAPEAPSGGPNHGQGLLFLLPSDADERLKQLQCGEFTGEQIRRDHPELFAVVVKMGELGMSLRLARDLTGLSKNTVAAIYDAADVGTAAQNARLAIRARRCLLLLFDEIEVRLEDATGEETKDLAVLCGILLDKLSALQGGPTVNVNVRHEVVPGFEDYLSKLKHIKTGLGAAGLGQMGASGADLGAAIPGLSAGARTLDDTAEDEETTASGIVPSVDGAGDTVCDANRDAGLGSADARPGGEGVAVERARLGDGGDSPSRILGQMADASDPPDPPA